jgi:hypothetical protein
VLPREVRVSPRPSAAAKSGDERNQSPIKQQAQPPPTHHDAESSPPSRQQRKWADVEQEAEIEKTLARTK